MNLSLAILYSALTAFAGDLPSSERLPDEPISMVADGEPVPLSQRDPLSARVSQRQKAWKTVMPPLRLDTRVALRDQMAPGVVVELGTQLLHEPGYAVDMNLSYGAPRGFLLPGPMRTMSQVNLDAELLFNGGRFLKLGPTAGLAYRLFWQQWTLMDEGFVPVVGFRANSSILQARKWSLVITARATMDLNTTNLVLETAQVRRLSPYEGQLGLRFNFGHGRDPTVTK